jgi:UDP-N-acetylmuramyl pentapeptide phosphotransferase/UDP-N-acetylglucosamine-1-phosphate transferase/glycosyltransferase involved in cell wall biosynthesis
MEMRLAIYLGGAAASLALTPLVIRAARALSLVDSPAARKVHSRPVPRVGGIAIALGFLVPNLLAFYFAPASRLGFGGGAGALGAFALLAGIVFLTGLIDDLWNVPSRIKLVVLLGCAAGLCKAGVVVHNVAVGGTVIDFGPFAWPLTILWIAGVTVSMNFIDGLDGLAAGIAAIACGVLAILAAVHGDPASAVLSLALLGSLCGFLVFNFNPARVFMGDCGSMLLGFTLGTLTVASAQTTARLADLALPALALGVPIMDCALTMIRRAILQRRSIFAAERGHIHHCLIDRGFKHRDAVLVIYAVTFLCASLGLLTLRLNTSAGRVIGALGVGVLVVLFQAAGSVRVRSTIKAILRHQRRRRDENQDRHVFEETQLRLQHATEVAEWWRELAYAADRLGLASLRLPMPRRDGTEYVLEWSRDGALPPSYEVMRTTVGLRERRAGCGRLRFEVGVLVNGSLEVGGRRLMLFQRLLDEFSLEELGRWQGIGADRTPRNGGSRCGRTAPADGAGVADRATRRAAGRRGTIAGRMADLPAEVDRHGRRIAIVHDFLYVYAGAERVLEQMLAVYPEADLFSLFDFVPEGERGFLRNKSVRTSFIQNLPFARNHHRAYLPLMPLAIEQLDVSQYDLVISSSYVAAKGVLTRADQLHVCYCHTPVRFAWDMQKQYRLGRGLKLLATRLLLHYIRSWDVRSANGVDVFLTNSNYVGRRIDKIYRRRSKTLYPPVSVEQFQGGGDPPREDFYLTVSRLVPYKRIELLAEAFTRMGDRSLVIIGDGPEMAAVRAAAGPNVRVLGHQPDEVVRDYLSRARAFVFAAEEDFGIAPVEAQACGTPVICFGRGGVTESVCEGMSGVFFHEQSAEAVIDAVRRFEAAGPWDSNTIRASAERFTAVRFRKEFEELVEAEWAAFARSRIKARASVAAPVLATIAPYTGGPQELTLNNTDQPFSAGGIASAAALQTAEPWAL